MISIIFNARKFSRYYYISLKIYKSNFTYYDRTFTYVKILCFIKFINNMLRISVINMSFHVINKASVIIFLTLILIFFLSFVKSFSFILKILRLFYYFFLKLLFCNCKIFSSLKILNAFN